MEMMNITERELLERLRSNLLGRETDYVYELFDEIVIAFEDAEVDGEAEVVVTEYREGILQAYLNHTNSPIYFIEYVKDEEVCKVVNVYEGLRILEEV